MPSGTTDLFSQLQAPTQTLWRSFLL